MQVEGPEDNVEKFLFSTPENPGNEDEHSPIQTRIIKELRELSELEKLDSTENEEFQNKFLSNGLTHSLEDFMTKCNEEPTQDWQRRWNVGMILRHNARHTDDPKPLPQWIIDSSDSYATLKRPLPESKADRIYIYDTDYRCDPRD